MAKLIGGEGAQVTVNSVDLSDHCSSASLSINADSVETTAFGETTRSFIGGLESATLNVTWQQDYAASEVDASLNGLVGTVVTFEVIPASGSVSATNPKYSGSVLITDYTPVSAEVGSLATFSSSWPTTGAITRATS
jgi:hypothetical protein